MIVKGVFILNKIGVITNEHVVETAVVLEVFRWH